MSYVYGEREVSNPKVRSKKTSRDRRGTGQRQDLAIADHGLEPCEWVIQDTQRDLPEDQTGRGTKTVCFSVTSSSLAARGKDD